MKDCWQSRYDGMMDVLEQMEIVDSHEHLPPETVRLGQSPDFFMLFSHYCPSDLQSAGMTANDIAFLRGAHAVGEKWRRFAPFYHLIQDGSYCRAAHLAMRRFYGMDHLESEADAEALTAAIRKANQPGLYRRVLKDACRIRLSVNFTEVGDDPGFFAVVPHCTWYAEAAPASIRLLEERRGSPCARLCDYVEAVREDLRRQHACGLKGIKLHFAYFRDLDFAPQTHADAERVFLRVIEEGYGWRTQSLGYGELRPLQDYLVHRLVEIAIELDVPMVFHTGLLAEMRHRPADADPLLLWNLIHRYRQARFVLLHAGLPWMEEAAMLAKQYPNVWLDMAWDHLISPVLSRRALAAWMDMLPMNKIFGFGGDYNVVEKVYGHLVLARENLAAVLADKQTFEGMRPDRARAWLQAMLFDNPNQVYRLGL